MDNDAKLILSKDDYQKISYLIMGADSNTAVVLGDELNRASIVPTHEVPKDVIAMNSSVRFVDQSNGRESVVTLVYPHDARIEEHKISVLSPVGSALIGLRVGDAIQWPLPQGRERTLKIIGVV
ncbi:MAG: nucleoside diphosphate kinase regulator [Bdellovibrionota bacterium]